MFPDLSSAACGGLIQDASESYVVGFSCNIGTCSIMHAELYGIWFGMKLAIDHGVQRIYIDSRSAWALIEKGCKRHHPCAPIIHDITSMKSQFAQVRWSHVFREANACADTLAKHLNMSWGCQMLDQVLAFLYIAFISDCSGTLFDRVT